MKDFHEVIFFIRNKDNEFIHKARCGCAHKNKREMGQCKRHYTKVIQEAEPTWTIKTTDTTSNHLPTVAMVTGIERTGAKDETESGGGKIDKKAVEKLVKELVIKEVDKQTIKTVEIKAPEVTIKPKKGEIQHPQYSRLARWIAGDVTRLWLFGPAGTGKTHAAIQIAEAMKLPYYLMPRVADEYQFSGYKDANGTYHDTPIHKWAHDPNPQAVLILDEVDRNLDTVNIWLNSALANGEIVFPDGAVRLNPKKLVIATANTNGHGNSITYSAAQTQDAALLDRFPLKLNWDLDPVTEKAIAVSVYPYKGTVKAVTTSQLVREALTELGVSLEWGPRRTFALCAAVASGETLKDALCYAGLNDLDEHNRSTVFEAVKL